MDGIGTGIFSIVRLCGAIMNNNLADNGWHICRCGQNKISFQE